MIGNDIVDRALANRESSWQRRGFLAKLFTDSEQQLILTAEDPECMVWLLWSMKESAYKASIRETGKRVFNPKKLSCILTAWTGKTADGVVLYEGEFHTRSIITLGYIASLAGSTPDFSPCRNQQVIIPFNQSDYTYQSASIRAAIIQQYAEITAIPEKHIYISNDQNGIPALLLNDSSKKCVVLPITISHHGNYGAYAINTMPQ